MPAYRFTRGTMILLIALVPMIGAFADALLFDTTGLFIVVFGLTTICSLGGAYAASTKRMAELANTHWERGALARKPESAALVLSLVAAFLAGLFGLAILAHPTLSMAMTLMGTMAVVDTVLPVAGGVCGKL